MRQLSLLHWDKAFDPTAWNNFIMPLLPMSMCSPKLN